MNRFKVFVLATALATTPLAVFAQDTPDISGDWEVTVDSPQGPATIDASFKQAGEAVTGTVTSPMGSVDFKGTLVKNVIAVAYRLDVQGNALDITMNGTVTGDEMAGNLVIAGMGEVPWKAKKKAPGAAAATAPAAAAPAGAPAAAAAGAPTNITGKWDITLNTGQGEFPMTADFTQTGDKVTGTFSSQMGDIPVAGTMTGTSLKMEFVAPSPQGDIAIKWNGDLSPNGFFKGTASMEGIGDAEWVGKRSVQ
jgi:hypothetical protein